MMKSAVATQVVPLPLDQAIEQWFLVVWIRGGGMGVPTVESNGNDNRVGHTRVVGGNIKEQITKFEHPTLVEYKIVSGLYPVNVLTGTVKFIDVSIDNLVPETQIIWTFNDWKVVSFDVLHSKSARDHATNFTPINAGKVGKYS
jgi:hypothetical protein